MAVRPPGWWALVTNVNGRVCSVSDDKPVQEEDWVPCQHPECAERRRASKVGRNSRLVLLHATHRGQNGRRRRNTEEQTMKPEFSSISGQF